MKPTIECDHEAWPACKCGAALLVEPESANLSDFEDDATPEISGTYLSPELLAALSQ